MSDLATLVIAPDAVTQLLQMSPHSGEFIVPSPDPETVAAWLRVLSHRMLAIPKEKQADLRLEHSLKDGLYLRKLFIPKGTLLIGKIHKTHAMNIVCQGDIAVMTESGSARIRAGYTVMSPPGFQKLGFAHEDTIFCNVFHTTETDLDKAEDAVAYTPDLRPHDEDITDFCGFMREYGLSESGVEALVLDRGDHAELPPGQQNVRFGPSEIHESGAFAMRDFTPGEVIAPARIGNCRTQVGRLINHCLNPNCSYADDFHEGLLLMADQYIASGDELSINYRQAARVNVSLGLQPLKE